MSAVDFQLGRLEIPRYRQAVSTMTDHDRRVGDQFYQVVQLIEGKTAALAVDLVGHDIHGAYINVLRRHRPGRLNIAVDFVGQRFFIFFVPIGQPGCYAS